MQEPVVAQKSPIEVQVEAGQSYWWCACGRSQNQPWCDGSHAGTDFLPQEFKASRDRTIALCACKKTGKGPYCDGTHNGL